MADKSISSISIIGAGNVATHLAIALFEKSIPIKEVWSNHPSNADLLAAKVNAKVSTNLGQLDTDVQLVIVSVKDDALVDIIKRLPEGISAIVHTSGSMDMKLLKETAPKVGVFYPLQSFNKNEPMAWTQVPICIEANNDSFANELFKLGEKLSENVQYINSTQRIQLHIAAIFANNFSNYLFSMAYDVVTKQHLPFSLLTPLIKQTADRLGNEDPFILQTGPAMRNDLKVINGHMELLKAHPEAQKVYQFISDQIIKKADQ
jgi:predicted short-subunit dehydrogenase-like oxidoreductase (DUF2520 family)